jgi:endonuclease/exonuclease/phosphatase (EEP) superfamily protein YafD
MKGFRAPRTILTLSLLLAFSSPLHAKRWGFAKKFKIPAMADSHVQIGDASQSQLNPNSIRILVWNLYKGEKEGFTKDFKRLSIDKDILLLQEGYLDNYMTQTLESMSDFQFDMGVSFIYKKKNNTRTGSFIGSRVKPDKVYFTRTKDFEPFIKTPKTTTYAYYPIAGSDKQLLALSIHGINFANHQAFVNHVNQSVDMIKNHDGPVIYGGDFNTRTKKRTRHLKRLMTSLGMKETTFRNDKRMRAVKVGQYLDHVFIKGLLVRDAEVLKNIKSSDHKAMVLDLVLDK